MTFNAIDLFSGCGGLTSGMKKAGFNIKVAIELDATAVETFKLNHTSTKMITKDIRDVRTSEISKLLKGERTHFLAGCPPCQGFSTVRKLNKRRNKRDSRNNLILEYMRFVIDLRPLTIMLENVPGVVDYYLFRKLLTELKRIGYYVDHQVVNIKEYGVPQSRRRLVLVGSLLDEIKVVSELNIKHKTVRQTLQELPEPAKSNDWLHQVVAVHTKAVQDRIRLTPKDGGSRKDLPEEYTLSCHTDTELGFNDIYGRLRWDTVSSTITGGCLNPSKGRFLHPEQDRCISAREAALLQSFPRSYKFAKGTSKTDLALMIGNALPPKFSYYQSKNIYDHLITHIKST